MLRESARCRQRAVSERAHISCVARGARVHAAVLESALQVLVVAPLQLTIYDAAKA